MVDLTDPVPPEQIEIERLKGIIRRCMRGVDMVHLGDGEYIGLHLSGPSQSFRDIKAGINTGDLPAGMTANTEKSSG